MALSDSIRHMIQAAPGHTYAIITGHLSASSQGAAFRLQSSAQHMTDPAAIRAIMRDVALELLELQSDIRAAELLREQAEHADRS